MVAKNTYLKTIIASVSALSLLGGVAGLSYGADVSMIGTVDVTSTGKVSTSKMLPKGTLKSGVFIDSSSYAVPLKTFSPDDSELRNSNDKLLSLKTVRLFLLVTVCLIG